MMPRYRRLGWFIGSGVVLAFFCITRVAAEPNVAAASSLNQVLQEISRLYRNHSGQSVNLIFGSSRGLAHQIRAGAPYDIFLSADAESIRLLQKDSRADGQQVVYGKGRLALFVVEGSPFRLSSSLRFGINDNDFARVRKFAIANPYTAPYGRIAGEALRRAGVWNRITGRLVIGQSALQAAQFVLSRNADAALLPYSLVLGKGFAGRGTAILVSETLYTPLSHEMILVRGAGDDARKFFRFLQSETVMDHFASNGL